MVRYKLYSTHWQFTRFFHKSNITCIISGTRTGTLPEHTSLPGFFCGIRIAQSLFLCVVSSRSLLFWLSCLGTLVLLLPKTLNYSDFQSFESFDFERTGWRLFQKRLLRPKLDIHVFIILLSFSIVGHCILNPSIYGFWLPFW